MEKTSPRLFKKYKNWKKRGIEMMPIGYPRYKRPPPRMSEGAVVNQPIKEDVENEPKLCCL